MNKTIKQYLSLFVIVFLFLSTVTSLISINNTVKAENATGSLISNLTTLLNNANVSNWTETPESLLAAYAVGKATATDVQNYVASLTNSTQIFYAAAEFSKLGYSPNETQIKSALDNHPMLANGLPRSDAGDYFSVYDRFLLNGFQFANDYNYSLNRWNVTQAYLSFKTAMATPLFSSGSQGNVSLLVYGNTTSYTSQGPRFYDESAETLDCYLRFFVLGIDDALDDASVIWDFIQTNFWGTGGPFGSYYGYQGGNGLFECEAGGFDQIALKYYWITGLDDIVNSTTTDIYTRCLSQRWASPMWGVDNGNGVDGADRGVCVHANSNYGGTRRLENNVMLWSTLYSSYYTFNDTARSKIRDLLTGYTNGSTYQSAWQKFYNTSSTLGAGYSNSTGIFDMTNGKFSTRSYTATSENVGSAYAAVQLMLFGIVPQTGSLAIPLSENVYQDVCNLFDHDLFAINVTARTLTFSVLEVGNFTFQYGTTPFNASFPYQGIYNLTFASDWNSITNTNYTGALPENRAFLYSGETPGVESPTLTGITNSFSASSLFAVSTTTWNGSNPLSTYYVENNASGTMSFTTPMAFTTNPQTVNVTFSCPNYETVALRWYVNDTYGLTTISDWYYINVYPSAYSVKVISQYGNPTANASIAAGGSYATMVSTPYNGATGTRYVCTGYSIDNNAAGVQYSGASYTFSGVQSNHTIYYYWKTQYYLTTPTAYGTASGAGWYDAKTNATVSIASTVSGGTGTQYILSGWAGSGTNSYTGSSASYQVNMTNPITETANWVTQYYLTVTSKYGTVNGSGWYNSGAIAYASLNASVVFADGMNRTFSGWSSGGSDYTQSDPITMNAPLTVIAGWIPDTAQVVIYASAGTGGTISPSGSVVVEFGNNQTFTITPNEGYNVAVVTVNGENKGALLTYTFYNVTATQIITVTFLPTYTAEKTQNLTLYFRSNSYTFSGIAGYELSQDYRNDYGTITVTGNTTITYGFKIYLVSDSTHKTELSNGPVATIALLSNFSGIISASWICPETNTALGIQGLEVDIYASTDSGDTWTNRGTFVSSALMTEKILSTQWTFKLFVTANFTSSASSTVYFGNANYKTSIENVQILVPKASQIGKFQLFSGDLVGFIFQSYFGVMGSGFYGLVLFGICGSLYRRYGHVGSVLVFFVIFGGSGGLLINFLPSWAAGTVAVLMILMCTGLLWRVIR